MIEFLKKTNMRFNSFLTIVFLSQAVASLGIIYEFKKVIHSDAYDRFMTLVLMFEVMVG